MQFEFQRNGIWTFQFVICKCVHCNGGGENFDTYVVDDKGTLL